MADYEALTALIDVAGLKKEGKVRKKEFCVCHHGGETSYDDIGGVNVRWFYSCVAIYLFGRFQL